LRTHARNVDLAARFAGDEFAMILIDVSPADARGIVERILTAIRSCDSVRGVRLSSSAGIALSYPIDTAESIVERADSALYQSKQAGRDQATLG